MKVLRHSRGYVVSVPHKHWRKGGKYKIAFPITDEARKTIEDAVMAEYEKVAAEATSQYIETAASTKQPR